MDLDQSRQFKYIAALGSTTMNKFSQFKIFLHGLRGTGAECAKNLVLAQPKNLVIHDDDKVRTSDLSVSPLYQEADLGKPRSESCFHYLQKLNPEVDLAVHKGEISLEMLTHFNLVIFTDNYTSLEKMFEINEFCRSQKEKIGFIYAGTLSLFGFVFVDFGEQFKVYDKDGEPSKWYAIENITKSSPGEVTVEASKPHSFRTGDFVRFSEIEGMTELNGQECRPIKVTSRYTFIIEDTKEFNQYTGGGRVEEVKVPCSINFRSLQDCLTTFSEDEFNPEWEEFKLLSAKRYFNLKLALYNLWMVSKMQSGTKGFPEASNQSKIKLYVDSARNMLDDLKPGQEFEESIVKYCIQYSKCQLAPLCSFFGGIAAMEALKYAGKYTPIKGFFFFDAFDCLPEDENHNVTSSIQSTSRYDDIQTIFGSKTLQKIQNSKLLLVGAGSTASEYLKNLGLLGFASGSEGKLYVVDDAKISKSDLYSYFPYKPEDVGKDKLKAFVEEGKRINSNLKLETYKSKIEEEQITNNDRVWSDLDAVVCALDYRISKNHVNSQSLWYEKPMICCAAHSLKCASQITLPKVTEGYTENAILNSQKYDSNTIRNFPYLFDHAITWATEIFQRFMSKTAEMIDSALIERESFVKHQESKELKSEMSSQKVFRLKMVHSLIFENKEVSFSFLAKIARDLYQFLFVHLIQRLTNEFPEDAKNNEGKKIWKGYHRFPSPVFPEVGDEYVESFILSTAKIFAKMFQIPISPIEIDKIIESQSSIVGFKGENKSEEFKATLDKMKSSSTPFQGTRIKQIVLEDENERGTYGDFLASSAYLRARCYELIPNYPKKFSESKYKVERIAFNIKLNIPLTNCIIVGLQVLELLKLIQEKTSENYRNYFMNLGVMKMMPVLPTLAARKSLDPSHEDYTVWDNILLESKETIEGILTTFEKKYGRKIGKLFYNHINFYEENREETYKKNLKLSPLEILTSAGLKDQISGYQYIELLYELGGEPVKFFLPRIKYTLAN